MIDPCSRIEKNKTAAIKSGIYAIKFDCSFFVVLGLLYIIIKYIIGMITARTLIMIVKIFIVSKFIEISNVPDRKSTRLNSSHVAISYAVFCLKKKKKSRLNK